MKVSLFKFALILIVSVCFIHLVHAQEYDDVYFKKSDREKLKELQAKESPTYGKDSYLYDEIDKLEGEDNDGILDKYAYEDESGEPTIVEKHYYYNDPSTRYYQDFDDVFWNDPFLYQGAIFNPYSNNFGYRSPYWRSGWNLSISFGNRWNRWNRRNWGGVYGNSWNNGFYGNSWNNGFYGDPWNNGFYGNSWNNGFYGNSWNNGFYGNPWCPPYYANGQNVITYSNRSNESRGISRGRRSSRNSSINSGGRNTERLRRVSSKDNSGGKGGRNGRYDDGSRTYRKSYRTYDNNATSPRRRSSTRTSSSPNRSGSRSYSTGSRSTRTKSNTYGSGSRSSSRSSGSRSSNATRSSSSSSKSKSSGSSRSSRSKRGN